MNIKLRNPIIGLVSWNVARGTSTCLQVSIGDIVTKGVGANDVMDVSSRTVVGVHDGVQPLGSYCTAIHGPDIGIDSGQSQC